MKVGLVARAEDRGLGILCWEFARHVQPDRTLVVRHPATEAIGFAPRLDRYPGATVVTLEQTSDPRVRGVAGALDPAVVRPWLDGLDVLYTAEVPYDWRLFDWCREAGVASVLHVMPESWRDDPALPRPDVVWAPTEWLADRLPADTILVPVPVAADRFDAYPRPNPGTRTLLHRVGHRASGDRNGTGDVLAVLRRLGAPVRVIVATQDDRLHRPRTLPHHVELTVETATRDPYWCGYDRADVLVMPRRYGGLCLPVQEAAAAGCALVLSDMEPNRRWPGVHVPTVPAGPITTPTGPAERRIVDHRRLAAILTRLARDAAEVADLSDQALAWAARHSWRELLPTYRAELARACA